MLILKLNKDKVLQSDKKSNNYTGENNFEKIRIVAPQTISGRSLSELKTKLYIINIIDDNWTTLNDCILCEFKKGKNENYVFEIPVKGQYTVFPQLGLYLKFTDEIGTVGKTNVVKTMILHHKDDTVDYTNTIDLFEKFKIEILGQINDINTAVENIKNIVSSIIGGENGGETYELPTATSERLGGVKIGDGINVTEDGTISSKSSDSATPEEVTEMIDEVFKENN